MQVRVTPFEEGNLQGDPTDEGPRVFAELWETVDAGELTRHAEKLGGLTLLEEHAAGDACLAFEFTGQRFHVVASQGEYLFFVDRPDTDANLLLTVARHFNELLRKVTTRVAGYGATIEILDANDKKGTEN